MSKQKIQHDIETLRFLRDVIQGTIQPSDGDPRREGEVFARQSIIEMIDAMIADAPEQDQEIPWDDLQKTDAIPFIAPDWRTSLRQRPEKTAVK